jgi:predicted cupin superfamily sugar epimerase
MGHFTLVGCTVAPGFDFVGFTTAPEGWHPGDETP